MPDLTSPVDEHRYGLLSQLAEARISPEELQDLHECNRQLRHANTPNKDNDSSKISLDEWLRKNNISESR
jgi:hypothetical protein